MSGWRNFPDIAGSYPNLQFKKYGNKVGPSLTYPT